MKRKPIQIACIILWILAMAGVAQAGWITLQLDVSKFGHLANEADDEGKGKCAATSLINSFVWLQNRYPELYDSLLIPNGNLDAARDLLHNRIKAAGGLNDKNVWQQKIKWIEEKSPNHTTYGGMVFPNENIQGWEHSGWLTNQYPSWSWLWGQINHQEDVEIGIGLPSPPGHWLTLTSMKFYDADSGPGHNGQWDPGEPRAIDFIDSNDPDGPNNDGQPYWADLNSLGDILGFDWWDGEEYLDATIEVAYKESPEPGTLALLGLGTLALLRRKRV